MHSKFLKPWQYRKKFIPADLSQFAITPRVDDDRERLRYDGSGFRFLGFTKTLTRKVGERLRDRDTTFILCNTALVFKNDRHFCVVGRVA